MGKRILHDGEDMELTQLRNDVNELTRRVGEVITILGGSASYNFKGIRADVHDLKGDVVGIKNEMEKMKREREEDKKKEGFISLKLDTIPQKIAGLFGAIAVLLTIVQAIKGLVTQEP